MLVVHGSWVPEADRYPARLALWAETTPITEPLRRGRKAAKPPDAPQPHPFAAPTATLRATLTASGAPGDLGESAGRPVLARLPSLGGAPCPSPDLGGAPDGAALDLQAWQVPALTFDVAHAPEVLLALADRERDSAAVVAEDVRFWIAATQFALELVYRQKILPAIRREGAGYAARWQLLLDEERDRSRFRALVAAMPPVCRALTGAVDAPELRPGDLLSSFLGAAADAVTRTAPVPTGRRTGRHAAAPQLAAAWIEALRGNPTLDAPAEALTAFYKEYRAWVEAGGADGHQDSFRVCFRLTPPDLEDDLSPNPSHIQGGESGTVKKGGTAALTTLPPARASWTLEYLLQATDDPSLLVPAGEVWRQRGSTLNFLNRKFDAPQERLLAGLGRAARLFPALEPSLRTARPEAATLNTTQAYSFVREAALLLQGSGFGVLVPGMDTAIGVRAKLSSKPATQKQAQGGAAVLTWDTLVNYDWQIALGDQTLSRAEFEALAALKQPLVQVRGRWVELRPELVEQALTLFKTQPNGPVGMAAALRMALAPATVPGLPLVEVETEGGFHDLLTTLRDGGGRAEIAEPAGFQGQLRPYQRVGVGWLAAMRRFGLGAVLADDMGLGKTIQLIALLLHERQVAPHPPGPTLLICPTSVVGNWRRELTRFGPDLRVLVHHGAERSRAEATFTAEAGRHDVVISTYALLHRDEAALTAVQWANVVLDEAQNIKNAATKWAQAARHLSADWRAALTGTPVENRLAELWSLFQFLNPGYLGSQEAFRRQFALPIERARDETAVAGLKALVSPFILRRLKTDRSIIADLPDKNEMKLYATLTREQATLYEATLQDALRQMAEASGIARRGIILGMLTKLKQICDHPALFLHDGSPLPGRSGKLARLTEMLEELLALDDRALIFTQYAEMGKLLQPHLSAALGREVIFLYGGTTAPERDRLVSRFQNDTHGPPIFILSVKAGGVGLNLTRANHVFHFDRWWNPAVENQATDRAFRIGQQKNVQVHKFISAGTFEEALDEIIERKKDLAETIVGAGESWITEMSTEQLRDLFTLRRDAVGEE